MNQQHVGRRLARCFRRNLPTCFAVAAIVCLAGARSVAQEAPVAEGQPSPLELEEPLSPLVPRHEPSDSEADRSEALKLFAAARLRERNGEQQTALRLFQRAYRRDPTSMEVLREIISLASQQGRTDQAVRYAVIAAELDGSDPVMLQRLGMQLTGEGQIDRALRLYEQALALQADQTTPSVAILAAQMGKLYYVSNRSADAADVFTRVVAAIEDPARYGIDDTVAKALQEDAAKTFELVGAKDDDDNRPVEALAFELFGSVFVEAGRVEPARAAFDRVHKIAPDETRRHWHQAQVHGIAGEPAESVAALEAFFAAHPAHDGYAACALLEKQLAALDRAADLRPRLERLHEADPANAGIAYYLAEVLLRENEHARAQSLLEQLIESEPQLRGYRALVGIYRQQGNTPALLRVLSDSVGRLRSTELLGEEGRQLVADQQQVEALLAEARRLVAENQAELFTCAAAAQIALEAGAVEAANELHAAAVALQPDQATELDRRWALALLVAGHAEPAVGLLERAVAAEPEQAELHYHLAGALEVAGRTDEALLAAQRASELIDPASEIAGRIAARRPWILYHARRYDEAFEEYVDLLDLVNEQPESEASREVARDALLVLSNICVNQGDIPQAEEFLEQLLDEFPEDVSALNDLGYLWADQGKHLTRSLAMIRRAVEDEPENQAYRDSLGWVLFRLGRYDEARAELEKAIEDDPDPDGVILDHLGDVYQQLGEEEKAREMWRRAAEALEDDSDPDRLRQVRDKLNTGSAPGESASRPPARPSAVAACIG